MRNADFLPLVALVLGLLTSPLIAGAVTPAERAVLYYFDGLHPDAIDRFQLPTLQRLKQTCTQVEDAVMIYPWHPKSDSYGLMHSTSLPNPITMTGNLFLREGQPMLQHQFPREANTAIATGSKAYDTLSPGFDIVDLVDTSDRELTDTILERLDRYDPVFYRIQLQDVGRAGFQTINAADDVAYQADIWHPESPYRTATEEADRQLGRFIDKMQQLDRWQSTFFVFMADGQSRYGWHLPSDEQSWQTPMIICGPGVRANHTIPYAEIIDIVPTMAAVLDVDSPNPGPGSGRMLTEIFEDGGNAPKPAKRLRQFNEQIRDYLLLQARLQLLAADNPLADNAVMIERNGFGESVPEPFLGIRQIDRWHEAGSIDNLLERNAASLTWLRTQLR
jgi:hypothetical protein